MDQKKAKHLILLVIVDTITAQAAELSTIGTRLTNSEKEVEELKGENTGIVAIPVYGFPMCACVSHRLQKNHHESNLFRQAMSTYILECNNNFNLNACARPKKMNYS